VKCLNCGKKFDKRKTGVSGYANSWNSFKYYCSGRCASYLSTLETLSRIENDGGRFVPAQTKKWKKKAAKTLRKVILDDKYNESDIPRFSMLGNAQYRPNQNNTKREYYRYYMNRLRMQRINAC
jgi:hypothetical protein